MKTRWMAGMAVAAALVWTASPADAQRNKQKPDASQEASVTQVIGPKNHITINYHRPAVKGRDVWHDKSDNPQIGRLVPHEGDALPWRAGANEATTITFEMDAKIEGQPVPAGTYALFMIPRETGKWTVILNKEAKQWGAFRYKQEQDLLRVEVTPEEAPHEEWLLFGFDNPEAYSAVAYLRWEKKKIPFKIEMDQPAS